MFNIFKKPYEKGTLEAWAKIFDDIAKVAFLAIPVMIYGKDSIELKLFNISILAIGIYIFVLGGRICRRLSEQKVQKED
ncbi:hypothetical protein [Avibacterium paragallinarum]|nr:hypothetical protein [Avibacterium paragallinarum]RZN55061.1 hypothetical protein EIG78_11495 [Avibacterium paragallinarum]TID15398.1 hypothetical protein JO83_10640 [Avibacterium paragallinarum]